MTKIDFTVSIDVDDDAPYSPEQLITQLSGLLTGQVKDYFNKHDFDIELCETEDASDDASDEESDEDEVL